MSLLKTGLEAMGLKPTEEQLNQFDIFYKELIIWNERMNLTGITDYEEVVVKHFLDSVNIVSVYNLSRIRTLIDVGAGAGFPGLPLKIMFPHLHVTMMDALNKRVQFMNHIIDLLDLDGIEAIHERAEIMAKDDQYRESYDLSVSRAVSHLATLSEYTLPFVKIGGKLIAYKSEHIEEEMSESKKAINAIGGKVSSVKTSFVPNSDISRSYVVVNKIRKTPFKYPRKAGTPSRKPIK